jgi:hypothetical protein
MDESYKDYLWPKTIGFLRVNSGVTNHVVIEDEGRLTVEIRQERKDVGWVSGNLTKIDGSEGPHGAKIRERFRTDLLISQKPKWKASGISR